MARTARKINHQHWVGHFKSNEAKLRQLVNEQELELAELRVVARLHRTLCRK